MSELLPCSAEISCKFFNDQNKLFWDFTIPGVELNEQKYKLWGSTCRRFDGETVVELGGTISLSNNTKYSIFLHVEILFRGNQVLMFSNEILICAPVRVDGRPTIFFDI